MGSRGEASWSTASAPNGMFGWKFSKSESVDLLRLWTFNRSSKMSLWICETAGRCWQRVCRKRSFRKILRSEFFFS